MSVADAENCPHAGESRLPREERRRRTEASILHAARELFAESGFERTTIRAVAARAGVDPALVMQYYGNKEKLFVTATHPHLGDESPYEGVDPTELPSIMIDEMICKFESESDREASIALIRSCLTHPSAAAVMRDDVMRSRVQQLADAIGGESALLRAELLTACLFGMAMTRYVLEMPELAKADPGDIAAQLLPVLRSLVDGQPAPTG